MNERIKQLLQESYSHFGQGKYRTPELVAEKFAELIIRDCIDCVDGYTKPRTFGTHYDAVEQIKTNFGIEE